MRNIRDIISLELFIELFFQFFIFLFYHIDFDANERVDQYE